MPPTHLLTGYRLPSATEIALPAPEEAGRFRRIGPWLSLRDKTADAAETESPPFRVVLDTGFDGTLIMPALRLWDALGGRPPNEDLFSKQKTFGRAKGTLRGRGYQLVLTGHPERDGPHDDCPAEGVLLTKYFEVFASVLGDDKVRPDHPILLGLQGLEILAAQLHLDYKGPNFLGTLSVEVPDGD